jgi:hypothetical protein
MSVDAEVLRLLDTVTPPVRRRDADRLVTLFGEITNEPARVWPGRIIGFGSYHYTYASGREGDSTAAGFAPRKAATSIYLPDGVGNHADLLSRLGTHTTGVGCLYLKDLDQVDVDVLEQIITRSYRTLTAGTFGHRARDSDAD